MQYIDSLNDKQKEAVLYTDGPLLIVAGAGAGKTKTITHRIIHLIHEGVDPSSILAVTFTNKAAKEMRDRVMMLLENKIHGVSAFLENKFWGGGGPGGSRGRRYPFCLHLSFSWCPHH